MQVVRDTYSASVEDVLLTIVLDAQILILCSLFRGRYGEYPSGDTLIISEDLSWQVGLLFLIGVI